jgi:hypothetical protein
MDKRSALKDMSAAELKQELIARLRDQIQKNEAENEALREQIRQFMPEGKAISGRGRSRTLARNDMSLREVVAQVLREAGEPLRVRDIIERVKAAGYVSKASNFAGIVNISLSNGEEMFEKVSRGVYRIREGAEMSVAD